MSGGSYDSGAPYYDGKGGKGFDYGYGKGGSGGAPPPPGFGGKGFGYPPGPPPPSGGGYTHPGDVSYGGYPPSGPPPPGPPAPGPPVPYSGPPPPQPPYPGAPVPPPGAWPPGPPPPMGYPPPGGYPPPWAGSPPPGGKGFPPPGGGAAFPPPGGDSGGGGGGGKRNPSQPLPYEGPPRPDQVIRSDPSTANAGPPLHPLDSTAKEARTVYVGNIPNTITEEQLMDWFTCVERPLKVKLCGDGTKPTQFAFVEFPNVGDAHEAIAITGTDCCGFSLKISQCGSVSHTYIVAGESHQPVRYGFVEFFDASCTAKAFGLSGAVLGQYGIRVSQAKGVITASSNKAATLPGNPAPNTAAQEAMNTAYAAALQAENLKYQEYMAKKRAKAESGGGGGSDSDDDRRRKRRRRRSRSSSGERDRRRRRSRDRRRGSRSPRRRSRSRSGSRGRQRRLM